MQHVLITGASRGLGRALALEFSAKGWTVSACATDPDAIRSLAKELDPEHLALTCEVTQPAEVGALATRVLERFGPPDTMLNNAAVINRTGLLWEVLPE
jgi:NAD(P)-dependent dehydrogenase (short-subunit alcohol dehydrogenase family)